MRPEPGDQPISEVGTTTDPATAAAAAQLSELKEPARIGRQEETEVPDMEASELSQPITDEPPIEDALDQPDEAPLDVPQYRAESIHDLPDDLAGQLVALRDSHDTDTGKSVVQLGIELFNAGWIEGTEAEPEPVICTKVYPKYFGSIYILEKAGLLKAEVKSPPSPSSFEARFYYRMDGAGVFG